MPNFDNKLGVSSKYHQRNISFVQHTVTWRQFQDQTCLPQPMASLGGHLMVVSPNFFLPINICFKHVLKQKSCPPEMCFLLKPWNLAVPPPNFKTQNRNHKLLHNKSRSLIQRKSKLSKQKYESFMSKYCMYLHLLELLKQGKERDSNSGH